MSLLPSIFDFILFTAGIVYAGTKHSLYSDRIADYKKVIIGHTLHFILVISTLFWPSYCINQFRQLFFRYFAYCCGNIFAGITSFIGHIKNSFIRYGSSRPILQQSLQYFHTRNRRYFLQRSRFA
jgi:hypothetical protein